VDRRRLPLEHVIGQMQRDIRISPMEARSNGAPPAFSISFVYPDKERAQAVVRELAAEIVSQNAMVNRHREENWRDMWPSDPPPPGQDLEILEMASLPQKPVGPNRFAFAASGLGAGLALGLLAALVMRWPKSTLRMAGFAVAGGALALGLSWFFPDTYTSITVLRFAPPVGVPERLGSAATGAPAAEQFMRLAQDVSSPASLSEIIRKPGLDLYPEARARKPLEEVAGIMRRNIVFRPLSPELTGGPAALWISFSYPDRLKAQAATRELVSRLVKRNIAGERARIEAMKDDEVRKAADHGFGEVLEVLDPATLPVKPAAPNRLAISAAGLGLGLLLGALAPRLRRRNRTPLPA
jgi:hypothetical protein